MIITKEIHFHMGHRIPNHKSKCANLHGHTYKLRVSVNGHVITKEGTSDEGMVIDFADLKEIMIKEVDDLLDHRFMVYEDDPLIGLFDSMELNYGQKFVVVDFIPTCENIARMIFHLLQKPLRDKKILLQQVELYETPTSSGIYTVEDSYEDDDQ